MDEPTCRIAGVGMEHERLSEHFSICVFCAKPIDDDYNFTVLVWGGVVTVVPIHKEHNV